MLSLWLLLVSRNALLLLQGPKGGSEGPGKATNNHSGGRGGRGGGEKGRGSTRPLLVMRAAYFPNFNYVSTVKYLGGLGHQKGNLLNAEGGVLL